MPDQPVDLSPEEPHSPGMEARVTRLETFMEATRADIADMRQELRAIRAEQSTLRTELHGEISAGRREMATMFRWLVGLMFTFFLASMGAFAAVYTQIETIITRIPK